MPGSTQPEEEFPSADTGDMIARTGQSSSVGSVGAGGDKSNGSRVFEETELDSALQLLVERAQYITGATGTALVLPQGEEMVCRTSAGVSAPAVGVRLQVRSGLTGESIVRRQLLRCDNAETDARVNLETCRALGIASIVVLGGWPTLPPLCSSFPTMKRGCPILAFFARVGRDAADCIILVMPRGLHRYYGAGHLHFITCSCYRRLLALVAKCLAEKKPSLTTRFRPCAAAIR